MRVAFAGTPTFSLPSLEVIHRNFKVVGVWTQPDRPAGRGKKLKASVIKEYALKNQLPIFQPKSFRAQTSIDEFKKQRPDIMIVVAYGLILPQEVLDVPKYGCINIHASILPTWRGAAPINYSILHGDDTTGVTIMQMDKGMDTGNIIAKVHYSISKKETCESLTKTLSSLGNNELITTITKIQNSQLIKSIQQDHNKATYTSKIDKKSAKIDFTIDTDTIIDRKVRAFNPWPMAWCTLQGLNVKVLDTAKLETKSTLEPGSVKILNKEKIQVATKGNDILFNTCQLPGKKPISAKDFINGYQNLFINKFI